MIDDKRLKEIEEKLEAVDKARPGYWISVVGSGHNQCTALMAELVEGLEDENGNRIDTPEACPYRDDPTKYQSPEAVQCKKNPMLRWVKLCNRPATFPEDCPLEPTKVSTSFVADCLPDYALKDDPGLSDHVPVLKFLETVKDDFRELIAEVNRLREIEVAGIKHVLSKSSGSVTRDRKQDKEIEKLRDCRSALVNLVDMIENEGLMPPSLSYFAEAKNAIEASE